MKLVYQPNLRIPSSKLKQIFDSDYFLFTGTKKEYMLFLDSYNLKSNDFHLGINQIKPKGIEQRLHENPPEMSQIYKKLFSQK